MRGAAVRIFFEERAFWQAGRALGERKKATEREVFLATKEKVSEGKVSLRW